MTANGHDWCIKALHPSDPITEVRGIPDDSAVPSVFMNYQSVYTVSPQTGATGTWTLDGQLTPTPTSFATVVTVDTVGTRRAQHVNAQITGSNGWDRLDSLLGDFQRWRLAYASVTIYQDGPDLANQGTVVVCQKPVNPLTFTYIQSNLTSNATTGTGMHPFFHLQPSDLPSYSASQAMPNAYFGKSKDGAYIPLKLTKTHQQWHGHHDLQYQCTGGVLTGFGGTGGQNIGGQLEVPMSATSLINGLYPFLDANDLHVKDTTEQIPYGTLVPAFCNENWADFSFRNMAVTTSLSFFYRFGFECQLQPGSILAPHLKLSPESDELAIKSYFAIARELKDAYPADYNDLGKIWDIISGIAKSIAPALMGVPVIGPALSVGVGMGATLGDRIKEAVQRSKQPTQGSTMSQSDLEMLRSLPPNRPLPPTPRRPKSLPQPPFKPRIVSVQLNTPRKQGR